MVEAIKVILPFSINSKKMCIRDRKWGEDVMSINNGEIGPISQKLYDNMTGIQWGKLPDTMGWTVVVE